MAYNLKEIQLLRNAPLEGPLEKPYHSAENIEGQIPTVHLWSHYHKRKIIRANSVEFV